MPPLRLACREPSAGETPRAVGHLYAFHCRVCCTLFACLHNSAEHGSCCLQGRSITRLVGQGDLAGSSPAWLPCCLLRRRKRSTVRLVVVAPLRRSACPSRVPPVPTGRLRSWSCPTSQ